MKVIKITYQTQNLNQVKLKINLFNFQTKLSHLNFLIKNQLVK